MSVSLRSLGLLLLLALPALALAGESHPLRWRIFADQVSNTSFRYPYRYQLPDQYKGRLVRGGGATMGSGVAIVTTPGQELSSEDIRRLMAAARQRSTTADVVHFSYLASDLPAGLDGSDLGAVLGHASGGKITAAEAWDYYSNVSARPHADSKWAPEGVTAALGSGGDFTGLVVRHADRWSGLVLTGGPSDHDNAGIIESFEIMAGGGGRNRPNMTWREAQVRRGNVFDHQGKMIPARTRVGPVGWDIAFEAESQNYHVTCTVSPERTLYYLGLMEALYAEYAKVFRPDAFPPYKMEIHIENDVQSFIRFSAAAFGIQGLHDGSFGQVTGGFFMPGQLCIVSYHEPVKGYSLNVDKTLAHEASHQFLHVACNGSSHVPTWINEGLAVYFEAGEFRNGKYNWQPPRDRIGQLKQEYSRTNRTMWPLDQYLDHRGHIHAAQYAEVYAITHFWIFGSRQGLDRFRLYWQALRDGEDGAQAFERIFMEDMVKARGSRSAAVQLWTAALLDHVKRDRLMSNVPTGR